MDRVLFPTVERIEKRWVVVRAFYNLRPLQLETTRGKTRITPCGRQLDTKCFFYTNIYGEPKSIPESAEEVDKRLQHIDPKMIEMIRSEIMDNSSSMREYEHDSH